MSETESPHVLDDPQEGGDAPASDIFQWTREGRGRSPGRSPRIGTGEGSVRQRAGGISTRGLIVAFLLVLAAGGLLWTVFGGGGSDQQAKAPPEQSVDSAPAIPEGSAVLGDPTDQVDPRALRKLPRPDRPKSPRRKKQRRPRPEPPPEATPPPAPTVVAPSPPPVQSVPVAPSPPPMGRAPEFL